MSYKIRNGAVYYTCDTDLISTRVHYSAELFLNHVDKRRMEVFDCIASLQKGFQQQLLAEHKKLEEELQYKTSQLEDYRNLHNKTQSILVHKEQEAEELANHLEKRDQELHEIRENSNEAYLQGMIVGLSKELQNKTKEVLTLQEELYTQEQNKTLEVGIYEEMLNIAREKLSKYKDINPLVYAVDSLCEAYRSHNHAAVRDWLRQVEIANSNYQEELSKCE